MYDIKQETPPSSQVSASQVSANQLSQQKGTLFKLGIVLDSHGVWQPLGITDHTLLPTSSAGKCLVKAAGGITNHTLLPTSSRETWQSKMSHKKWKRFPRCRSEWQCIIVLKCAKHWCIKTQSSWRVRSTAVSRLSLGYGNLKRKT